VPEIDRKPVGFEGFGGNAAMMLLELPSVVFCSSLGQVCDFAILTTDSEGLDDAGATLRLLEIILGPGPEGVLTFADDFRGSAGLDTSAIDAAGGLALGALRFGPFALAFVICSRGFASPSGDPLRMGVGAV
jgi:hypothetical protein